jgi:hypothetical protein
MGRLRAMITVSITSTIWGTDEVKLMQGGRYIEGNQRTQFIYNSKSCTVRVAGSATHWSWSFDMLRRGNDRPQGYRSGRSTWSNENGVAGDTGEETALRPLKGDRNVNSLVPFRDCKVEPGTVHYW